jgi:tetratricopeptide (TPR) repeat protein
MRNRDPYLNGVRSYKTVLGTGLLFVLLLARSSFAEIKVIEAEYAYALGDNDSKVDARRIATQEAQRKALEQAGTFVASLTEVKEYRLTKDEVFAYTAGIVATDVVAAEDRGTERHPEVAVRVKCRIDTDVLVREIDRYQDNEELREQLDDMARQRADLQKERDGLVKQLAAEKDKEKAAEAQQRLGNLLTREESIGATNRIWAQVSPQLDFYSGGEVNRDVQLGDLENAIGKLETIVQMNPENQQARLLLATLYDQQNDLPRAEKLLREGLALHPNRPLLHMRLGIVLREQKRYAEAFREFRYIEKKRPNQPQMLFQAGLTHKASGNCRLAAAYMKRLLLYTRNVDRPEIEKLKPKARQVVESCGGQVPSKGHR